MNHNVNSERFCNQLILIKRIKAINGTGQSKLKHSPLSAFYFLFKVCVPIFLPSSPLQLFVHIFLYILFSITLLGLPICIRKKNALCICLGDGDIMILELLEIDNLKIEIIFEHPGVEKDGRKEYF